MLLSFIQQNLQYNYLHVVLNEYPILRDCIFSRTNKKTRWTISKKNMSFYCCGFSRNKSFMLVWNRFELLIAESLFHLLNTSLWSVPFSHVHDAWSLLYSSFPSKVIIIPLPLLCCKCLEPDTRDLMPGLFIITFPPIKGSLIWK